MKLDPRLLRELKSNRLSLALAVGLGLGAGILTILQARVLSRAIHQVFLEGASLRELPGFLFVLPALFLLRAALAWGSEVLAAGAAARIKQDLRQRLFAHLLAQDPLQRSGKDVPPGERAFQGERAQTGELTNVLTEGIEALEAYFNQYLPQLALAALVPPAVLAFVFPLDGLSGVVLLLTAPLIPLFMILIGSLADDLTKKQWLALSRMSAYFLDVLQGLTTLKVLGRSRAQIKEISRVSDRYRLATMNVLRVTFLSALALELVATISTALVAVQIGLRLLYGQGGLSFEEAFFILVLAPEFYLPLRLLGGRFHAGMAGVAAGGRIFQILERPLPTTAADRTPTPDQGTIAYRDLVGGPLPSLIFENVTYTYPDNRTALEGVSFRLEAGRKTALVGPSGAGKSTVAHLLLGFRQPGSGRIRVGKFPLETIPPTEWRRWVSWVPQNPFLFQGSVAENIRLARPEASFGEVEQAARLACAEAFIQALPQGYETEIGERGVRLSRGQAQRLALARAFLKDAPLLIMDEPTSNLDPETEAQLQEAVIRLARGRTILVIAHRLNTVVNADQILVLEQGRLVEAGTHPELLARDGLYRRLVGASYQDLTGFDGVPDGKQSLLKPVRSGSIDQDLTGFNRERDRNEALAQPVRSHLSRPPSPLLRLLRLASPHAGRIALAALLGFATVGSGIGLMATSATLLARAALHPSIAELQVAIVGVRFFGLARGIFRYLERLLSHDVTLRLLARLRTWFYAALEPLAPARLQTYHSGDLISRIVGDTGSLESFFVRALAPPLVAGLTALAAGGYLAGFHPSLAVVLLVCMALLGVGTPLVVRAAGKSPGQQVVRLRAGLNRVVVDGLQGRLDLLAFGQEGRQLERLQGLGRELAGTQMWMARLQAGQNSVGGLLAGLGMWAVLALAIPRVSAGQIEGVFLPAIALAALASFEAVQPLPLAAQHLESHLEAARRLFAIVDGTPEVQEPEAPLPVPDKIAIEARDLLFRYPAPIPSPSPVAKAATGEGSAARTFSPPLPVFFRRGRGRGGGLPAGLQEDINPRHSGLPATLSNLSFSLPPGKRLAIVGPSGAGKSTLINLLLRFWDFEAGEIRLGGDDLRRYDTYALRSKMASLSQDTYLFAATVRENLLIARPGAGQAELDRAAQKAQIHDFIQQLPQGYETWIGEHGLRLSAGERQRLAIARALLKDAPLLILDEATANLDAVTEHEVLKALYGLMEGRTVLAVTHRLVGLEAMDEILVLQAGRVVERGRHGALLERGGLYRRMWELQNQILNT